MILFAGNEAACAALTKGARKDAIASMLLLTPWAIAPQNDVAFCTERVPSKLNPAGLASRDEEISFPSGL